MHIYDRNFYIFLDVRILTVRRYYSNLFLMIILIYSSIASISSSSLVIEHENISEPFNVGLELQENHNLVPWARDNRNYQKQPIFKIKNTSGKELFHVEIDTADIEFVTKPFLSSDTETFKSVFDGIKILTTTLESLSSFDQSAGIFPLFSAWWGKLEIINRRKIFIFEKTAFYDEQVHDKGIHFNVHWKPTFQPQVTIQHPLEYTIPISFGLFLDSTIMNSFIPALPRTDANLQTESSSSIHETNNNYFDKKSGFLFLYGLTLYQMTPSRTKTDSQLLKETQDKFGVGDQGARQVDAKINLSVLSRRPFSDMWLYTFGDQWFESLFLNQNIYKIVSDNLYRANYAVEFYNPDGSRQNLSHLKKLFNEDALGGNPKSAFDFSDSEAPLDFLLKNGIVSTVMLRDMIGDPIVLSLTGSEPLRMSNVFDSVQYFRRILNSIRNEEPRHFIELGSQDEATTSSSSSSSSAPPVLNLEQDNDAGLIIRQRESLDDLMSPPLFLPLRDSMGFFRSSNLVDFNIELGEAVTEFRQIKNVGKFFLNEVFAANNEEVNAKMAQFLSGEVARVQGKSAAGIIDDICEDFMKLIKFLSDIREEGFRNELLNKVIEKLHEVNSRR